jgi:hypothetical protein
MENLIRKIQKALALAGNNPNEHERERAMEAAREMAAKHNLDLAELQGESFLTEKPETLHCSEFRLEKWVRRVLAAACEINFCRYYWQGRVNSSTPIFVGKKDNIALTIETSKWLLDSIKKQSNSLYKTQNERNDFRLGAATELMFKAQDIVKAQMQQQAPTTGTSLMRISNALQKANEEFLEGLNVKPIRSRQSSVSPAAYNSGRQFGKSLNIGNKQISQS